jgi:hypothetical protein
MLGFSSLIGLTVVFVVPVHPGYWLPQRQVDRAGYDKKCRKRRDLFFDAKRCFQSRLKVAGTPAGLDRKIT